jgi:hypothetical protein
LVKPIKQVQRRLTGNHDIRQMLAGVDQAGLSGCRSCTERNTLFGHDQLRNSEAAYNRHAFGKGSYQSG